MYTVATNCLQACLVCASLCEDLDSLEADHNVKGDMVATAGVGAGAFREWLCQLKLCREGKPPSQQLTAK